MKKILNSILAIALIGISSIANAQTAPTVTTTSLPADLANLVGEAELMADLVATARSVRVILGSNASTGENQWVTANLNGIATSAAIAQAIVDAKASIKVSSASEEVGINVQIQDANQRISVYGFDTKVPVMGRGGYELPKFSIKLRLEWEVLVAIRNLRSVKVTSFDENGRVNGTKYLNINQNGFYFESRMAGKVMLELIDNNGNIAIYDLRRGGAQGTVTPLTATTTEVQIENVEFVTDKGEINLIPFSQNGKGRNVLGVVILTKPTTVSIAGRTTQNVSAEGFKYRKVGDTTWTTIKASANGLAVVPFSTGNWQIIPMWGSGFTEETLYLNPDRG